MLFIAFVFLVLEMAFVMAGDEDVLKELVILTFVLLGKDPE